MVVPQNISLKWILLNKRFTSDSFTEFPLNCLVLAECSSWTSWLAHCWLTCAGGPLRSSTRAHIPVQRGLCRGQHPTVAQRSCGRCQGLAAQSTPGLIHGVRVGHRHCHMHGEVLLRQGCGLQEENTRALFPHKHAPGERGQWLSWYH